MLFFKFGNPKRKIHEVHMNNGPSKTFKKQCTFLEQKKLETNKNWNSYELMKIWSNLNHSKVLNY
jgi:hypothetical protein